MKLITRSEYMQNSSELFNDYYAQFITESTKQFVISHIGLDKLRKSNCPHFNDIINHSDNGHGGWVWDHTPVNLQLARELNNV